MSGLAAGLTVVAVLAVSVPAAFWQIRRARQAETDRATAGEVAEPALDAELDAEPGINLADLDACELLWSLPAYGSGPDRLRQAIRDEQQKGEL